MLEFTNKVFRHLYSKAYIDLVNKMPEVPGWFYDKLDKPWKNERRRLALDKLNTRPFVKLLREYQPDMIVCTHFLPAEIVSWLKAKERIASRQAIIVTDFDVMRCGWSITTSVILWRSTKRAPISRRSEYRRQDHCQRNSHRSGLCLKRTNRRCGQTWPGAGSHHDSAVGGRFWRPFETRSRSIPPQHSAQVVAICGRNEELKALVSKNGIGYKTGR